MAGSHSKRVSRRISRFKFPVFYGDSANYPAFFPVSLRNAIDSARPPAPSQDPISRDFAQRAARPRDPAVRRLTVCKALRDIQGSDGRPMRAPQLLLRGRWLQCAGFHAGVPVKVHVSHERLVIELDRDRASQDEVLTRIAQVTEAGLPERDLNALVQHLKQYPID